MYLTLTKIKQENLPFAFDLFDEFSEACVKLFGSEKETISIVYDFVVTFIKQLFLMFVLVCGYMSFSDQIRNRSGETVEHMRELTSEFIETRKKEGLSIRIFEEVANPKKIPLDDFGHLIIHFEDHIAETLLHMMYFLI